MRLNTIGRFLAGLYLLVSPLSFADAPVWKISNGNDYFYIGGTIHVLADDDYPLPSAFAKAYSITDTLVLEADITEVQTPAFQQQLLKEMSYSSGHSLIEFLKPETLQALTTYCKIRHIPLHSLTQFKPGMLTVMMTMAELQNLGLAGTGVDQHFYSLAKNEAKTILFLESAEQQLALLVNMGKGRENELIEYTLRDISSIGEVMSDLKNAWRSGNLEQLKELGITPMQEMDETVYRQLAVDRNNAWMPSLLSLFNNQQKELVLVGALHLAGDDSLLKLLSDKGYQIQQMP
ncbi:MAG: TraB/GumN family protein [Oceanicoccus sp.]